MLEGRFHKIGQSIDRRHKHGFAGDKRRRIRMQFLHDRQLISRGYHPSKRHGDVSTGQTLNSKHELGIGEDPGAFAPPGIR